MKKNKKILVQVGVLVAILFAVIAIVNGLCIYRTSSKNHIKVMEDHTEQVLFQTRTTMEEFASLPWLLEYWQSNHAEMELPGDISQRNGEVMRLLSNLGTDRAESVTAEQADSLTPTEQRQFAEYCYLLIMPRYNEIDSDFRLESLYCAYLVTEDTVCPLFQAVMK